MRVRVALVASVVLHLGLGLVLALMPEPPPREVSEPRFTDVVLIDEVPLPAQAGSGPAGGRAAEPEPTPVPERTPETGSPEPRAPDRARGWKRPRGRGDASTDPESVVLPSTEDPDASDLDEGSDDPEDGALALSGHRDRAIGSGRAGFLRPRLSQGSLRAASPSSRSGAALLPAADAVIENPNDAGFVQHDDGRWIFHDPDPRAQWTAELLPDGRLRFEDHHVPHFDADAGGLKVPGLKELGPAAQGVQFWMRRKRRLLNKTKAMRLKMAVDFAEKNIDRQLKRLHRDLLAIWTSDKPPHTRRGLLFDVWDDCDERLVVDLPGVDEEGSDLDALRTSAAERARAEILAFIHRHLPASSADAYTEAELRTLNARRLSKARFEPYSNG